MKSPIVSRVVTWRRLLMVFALAGALRADEVWRLDNLEKIGGHAMTVLGAPRVTQDGGTKVITFDGAHDGLFIPAIPIAGAKQYTMEVLFNPAEGGLVEQRFFHLQDKNEGRAMIELRLNGKGGWWLDTFLLNAGETKGLALIDPNRVHETGKWYWVALRYDGKTMAHYVNGVKELEGEGKFLPFADGTISLGVRQNKVFWFKGAIREVRFTAEAVADGKLQRVK